MGRNLSEDLKNLSTKKHIALASLEDIFAEFRAAIDRLNTDHEEKIKNVRSELKTKNDEAAILQANNTRLNLHNKELQQEIDQKNQTIDALQAKAAMHATEIKGRDAIPRR